MIDNYEWASPLETIQMGSLGYVSRRPVDTLAKERALRATYPRSNNALFAQLIFRAALCNAGRFVSLVRKSRANTQP
jgi:hypothetical protein